MTDLTDLELLHELAGTAETEVDRHLRHAVDWHPHDYVPWSRGRDFAALGGTDFEESDSDLSPVARAALTMNLLTEDNLPSYHREIAENFSLDGAWGYWVHRWTAEEARHSIVLRDYLTVTRGVDPVELEELRMTQMQHGFAPGMNSMLLSVSYVTFQELATRISHRNTAVVCADPIAERMLGRVAADENLHMLFYRNILSAAIDLAPEQALAAVYTVLTNFQMPGAALPHFRRDAVLMAKNGIYDLRQHRDSVVVPVLRTWNLFDRTDLTGEAGRMRDLICDFTDELDAKAVRFEESRDRALARDAARRERGTVASGVR
ncbi:acyl-ACP desaturase [Tsukamurella strandjordii]|uniref:acyl-ACP desaturase n=1 Tax=Tsukamurella strandjordii TaxID=147577 RepID=UPI0031DE8CC3